MSVHSTKADELEESPSRSKELWKDERFLNYLREFIKQCGDLDWMHFAREAAKSWKNLSEDEKKCFRNLEIADIAVMAMNTPKSCLLCYPMVKDTPKPCLLCNYPMAKDKSKKSCGQPRKSREKPMKSCATPSRKLACRKPKPRKAACAPKKKDECETGVKCSRPGPVTNNGYLNFLRSYRKHHCGLKPRELVQQGAQAWRALSEEKKNRYRRMACKVSAMDRKNRDRRSCKKD
ncbi:histone-like protein 18C [Drosophila ficusphila]|uniref:histone-like protein 18C n=1 Tax=Drosophila ficusphila TaxID=30025 RepID=UPI0007E65305|nr:histone-like protein 18C [Drosophila ficusphila]